MDSLIKLNEMSPAERKETFMAIVGDIQEKIKSMEESVDKYEMQKLAYSRDTNHIFGDGFYLRDMVIPAGMFVITEIHATENPLFLMKGKCDIATENGVDNIEAPWYAITKPETQRVIYTHELCNFITVHPVKVSTIKEAEAACILTKKIKA